MKLKLIFCILLILRVIQIFPQEINESELIERFSQSKQQVKKEIVSEIATYYHEIELEELKALIEQLLDLTDNKLIQASLLNLLSDSYYDHEQYEAAISGFLQSYQLVVDLPPSPEAAYAFYALGVIYDHLQQQNKAIGYLDKAAARYSQLQDYSRVADINSNIGNLYENLSIYDDALTYYFRALMIYEELKDQEGIANSYVNIGNINQSMGHYKHALEYYSWASEIYKVLNDDFGISSCLNNMGIVYSDLDQYHKSLSYYLESLEYARKLDDQAGIATTLNNIGIIYNQLGDFDSSIDTYEQSLAISYELQDTWAIANTLTNIGELYIDYEDYVHGLDFLNRGLEISVRNNYIYLLMEGYHILAKYYSNIGEFQKAYQNYHNYVALKDSIVTESSKSISEIQSIYQNQKHLKEIELLEVKQNLGYRIRLILFIATLVFLLIIIWLLLLNNKKKKEILKRKKLEKNVLRLAHIVDQAETSIIMTDLSGIITYTNKYAERLTGYTAEEMIGKNPNIFQSGTTEEDTYKELWSTINTGQVWKGIFLNRKKNGTLYFEDAVIFPIKDENSKLINFAAVKKDITEQIKAQDHMKASEFRFRTMAKKINDGLLILENNKLVYVNDRFKEITGYDLPELEKLELSDLISGVDLQKTQEVIEKVRTNPSESGILELWIRTKKAERHCLLCALTHHKIDTKNSAFYLIVTDLTKRKKSEEKLLQSLNEKEILIKEIHHRVKNNMQVVSSLLQLQSRYIEDKATLEIFKKSQNRVKSMSLIHEKLYSSDDLAHIDFNDYVRKLTRNLLIFYNVDVNNILVKYNISEVYLGIVQAIPLGLIMNELISNSLKYAFTGKEKGLITISLNLADEKYQLTIEDNGVGIPENFDLQKSESLGLQLINSLTEQLHGKLELDRTSGTRFTLTFPRFEKIPLSKV